MNCPKCGTKNPTGSVYCFNCGGAMNAPPPAQQKAPPVPDAAPPRQPLAQPMPAPQPRATNRASPQVPHERISKRSIVVAVVLFPLVLLCIFGLKHAFTVQKDFGGTYTGVVHNLTGGISSDFTVSFSQDSHGAIEGCMAVKPPLGGSGYLKGQVEGSQVTFDVSSAFFVIGFKGQSESSNVNGTYLVSVHNGPSQNGTFQLQRTSLAVVSKVFSSSICPNDEATTGNMYYSGDGISVSARRSPVD